MICMVELGELEKEHEKFDSRGVQIVAVSLDGLEDSARTQEKLKHLVIVSDKDKNLAHAAEVIAPQHAPDGAETVAPTTVLIDRGGKVRWVFRPTRYINRLTPDELLSAVKTNLNPAP
jgi:peroxiredoxin